MLRKLWLLIVGLLLAINLQCFALDDLNFTGFIADEANVLSEQTIYDLNMTLWDLQKKSGADIAVVTIPSLNGQRVEDVAIDIGRTYKIGSKEKNNGVVFLTAVNDRKMRIEIGIGLENKISSYDLESIRDKDILPYYRISDYERGIARGTYKLSELVASVENVDIDRRGTCPARICNSSSRRERAPWWAYVIAAIMAPFSGRRRRSYGEFSGFGGGGGFGGSGCSGSW